MISPESRAVYDEYISQHLKLSHLWKDVGEQEEETEDTKRRKKERGKRRFEEDFEFINEDFY